MAVARFLVDTSAEARLAVPAVYDRLENLFDRGLVATCAMLNLEALWSAQSPEDYEKIWRPRAAIFEYVDTLEADLQRAQEVQRILAEKSMHRAAKLPDLIIAAVAERENLTLLHYDHDFHHIAEVSGQTVEWIVPRGSIQESEPTRTQMAGPQSAETRAP
jgi:predicted nucleic acid-binding protein